MALTPFDMEGVNRDLLAAGNPAKPDMQSILRRNARDLVLGNAILVSSVDAKELEFGVHMAYSDADGGFDTDPSEDVWFEASSLPIPNERPDLPPDNALRIRVTDVLTEYGFTDIDVKAPDRTPEGIWIGFEAMQPVRLDVTSAQEGRSVSFTLTAAEANDWRSGRLDAHGLSRMAVERVLARPGDTVTLAYGDSLFRPAVMCDGSGRLPEHRVKAGIGTFVIGRESEAVMPEILRIDRTVDPRDPLVIEKAFGKENDMENGNVPEYWKDLMDEADLPLAGIVREHGGGLMDFHRMKGIERLTGSSDWDFYSWTVENYDDDLLDVCERENAADVLADLQAWWKTSQPDMRQHVDEMMAGIDAAMEPLDKHLYAAAEKEFKERALDPDGECYQLDGGTFISARRARMALMVSMTASIAASSSGKLPTGPVIPKPAAFTRNFTSGFFSARAAARTSRSSFFVRSRGNFRSFTGTFPSSVSSRSFLLPMTQISWKPPYRSARRNTISLPIPEEAPVTMAIFIALPSFLFQIYGYCGWSSFFRKPGCPRPPSVFLRPLRRSFVLLPGAV